MRKAPRSEAVRLAVTWMAWFAALNVLWLALISAFFLSETVLGLAASALAATAAVAVSEQHLVRFALRPRWLLGLARIPGQSVRESAWIFAALWRTLRGRPVQGRFRIERVSLPDEPALSDAKRALLIAGESFAPNSYVLGIDQTSGEMLVHELLPKDEA